MESGTEAQRGRESGSAAWKRKGMSTQKAEGEM